jgi:RNA polymerase sigma-70 factor, ECF subfamily
MVIASSVQAAVQEFAAVCADEPAFRAWYEDAAPRVFSYLLPRTGGDHALSEELTQQAFIRAIRGRTSYDGSAPVVAWVCGIARNLLADHHRRLDREERSRMRLVVREIDAGPAHAVAEREEILTTLRLLPALQRAALVLRYLDDLSVREVARAIGKSEGATESLLTRAKERFRRDYRGADR